MEEIEQLTFLLRDALLQQGKRIATAESCTGGMIAKVITDVSGSSKWFDRGFVTYSNTAKHEMLGVPLEILRDFGAVSLETAEAMAKGALAKSDASVAISVTGIAGPDGGTVEKPVGTVFFAIASCDNKLKNFQQLFFGDRAQIRRQSCVFMLTRLLHTVASASAGV